MFVEMNALHGNLPTVEQICLLMYINLSRNSYLKRKNNKKN